MSGNSTRDRALQLLGNGQSPTVVALALGIDISRVSQLLSEDDFAQKVAELRFQNLQSATLRDQRYDQLEDYFLEKLDDIKDFFVKPGEVFRALMLLNKAQRRGSSDPTSGQQFKTIVKLSMPNIVTARFQVDASGIVIGVDSQELATMPSNVLMKEVQGEDIDKLLTDAAGTGGGETEAVAALKEAARARIAGRVLEGELETKYGI